MTPLEATTPEHFAPTFSIVMPAYNAGATISSAIESVLAQTRGDFELIVVDDGSTDDTLDRVQPYLYDERMRCISQPNLGPSSARNTAIAAARGTYASLLDSDDLWLPHYLEVMAATLAAEPEAAVAYTDAWALEDETRRIARATVLSSWHPTSVPKEPELFLRALLELGNFVYVGATIRRSVVAEVGPFRLGLREAEDYELWLRIAASGYRFVRCPGRLAIYRRRKGQRSAERRERIASAGNRVFQIVAEEYDVSEDIRALARQKLPMAKLTPKRPRRVPRLLNRPYRTLSRTRHFYLRPPPEVRRAFPDLRSL